MCCERGQPSFHCESDVCLPDANEALLGLPDLSICALCCEPERERKREREREREGDRERERERERGREREGGGEREREREREREKRERVRVALTLRKNATSKKVSYRIAPSPLKITIFRVLILCPDVPQNQFFFADCFFFFFFRRVGAFRRCGERERQELQRFRNPSPKHPFKQWLAPKLSMLKPSFNLETWRFCRCLLENSRPIPPPSI